MIKKIYRKEIFKNKLIIPGLFKYHDFNSIDSDSKNIVMYLIKNFYFLKYFFDKEELQEIVDKYEIEHQDKRR